jgi:hypothetical protein
MLVAVMTGKASAAAQHWTVTRVRGVGAVSAVSCSAMTACTAVGDRNGVNSVALVQRWDGVRWSVETTPRAAISTLSDVACTSARVCWAVGYYQIPLGAAGFPFAPVVERWNGSTWSIEPSPAPTAFPNVGNYLDAISCTTGRECTAVGSSGTSDNADFEIPLVEHWDGRSWSMQASPEGVGLLTGVSCPSATACIAVGNSDTSYATSPVAEHWNGRRWVVDDFGIQEGSLDKVSCVAGHNCVAVGGGDSNIFARWNGVTWATHPTGDTWLRGVACTSARQCFAVASAVIWRWNSSKWSTVRVVGLARDDQLTAISCPSARACLAVGVDDHGRLLTARYGP